MALSERALTTLETVKSELEITDSSMDEKLERWINAASDFVEKYTGRDFKKETKEYRTNGSGGQYLVLRQRPINVINSITYDDSTDEITDYLEDETDYKRGMLYRELGWAKNMNRIGLTADPIGTNRYYTVNYTYGYVLPQDDQDPDPRTLPYDLEQIVIDLVARKSNLNQLEAYGIASMKQGRLSYKFSGGDLDFEQKTTLNQYRKLSF